jgi:hypothetical protein
MSQDFNHEYQTMKEKKLTLTPTQQKWFFLLRIILNRLLRKN